MPSPRTHHRTRSVRRCLGLIGLLGVAPVVALGAAARPWAPRLATHVAWHDNATNAETASDVLPAFQLGGEVSASHRLLLARDDSLLLRARAQLESWPRYPGLGRAGPGCDATWQHKFGLGPFAPALRLEAAGSLAFARESGRAGRAGTLAAILHQRLLPELFVQARHERSRYDARALAFDRTAEESTALLGWQTPSTWELSLALRHRHGTVLSYSSPPRPDLVAAGKKLVLVDTFDRATALIAYYFPAQTHSAEIRATRLLGTSGSLTLAAEWRNTIHGVNAGYRNRLFTAGISRQH